MGLATISGFERELSYSQVQTQQLLESHHKLQRTHDLHNPYFNVAAQGLPLILDTELKSGTRVQVGPIGAFAVEHLAVMFHEQPVIYVKEGTMGRGYDQSDQNLNMTLMAHMMSCVSSERIIVSLSKTVVGNTVPFAGVQAQLGRAETTIQSGLEDDTGTLSSLGPSSSLYPVEEAKLSDEYSSFIEKYGVLPESSAWALSRLYRRPNRELSQMDVTDRGLSCLCMALLAVGVAKYPLSSQSSNIVLYDANLPGLKKMLVDDLDMKPVLTEGHSRPTKKVEESELRYHYTSKGNGGFMEDIEIGFNSTGQYYQAAVKLLSDNWSISI